MRSEGHQSRVTIASRLYAPEVGAAAFRLKALADGLASTGAEVRVLTTIPPTSVAGIDDSDGIRVSRFPVLRDAGGNVRGYFQYLSFDVPLFFRILFSRSDMVISEPPPTTGAVVAIVSWLRRRPFTYYAADIWSDAAASTSAPRIVVSLVRSVERFALRRAALVLAVSSTVADRVRELSGRSATVVGNGIDTTTFTPEGDRQESPGPLFVYTGTMSEWQGADIFVDALQQLLVSYPDVELHFFGQGSHQPAIAALVTTLPHGSVVFHGVVSPTETARWIRSATAALVGIVPDQGYDLARPTKIFAASACGTPVIFAGTGEGARLVTENELGWATEYAVPDITAAMDAAISQQRNGTTAQLANHRATWTRNNASLTTSGAAAARVVLETIDSSPRSRSS